MTNITIYNNKNVTPRQIHLPINILTDIDIDKEIYYHSSCNTIKELKKWNFHLPLWKA